MIYINLFILIALSLSYGIFIGATKSGSVYPRWAALSIGLSVFFWVHALIRIVMALG